MKSRLGRGRLEVRDGLGDFYSRWEHSLDWIGTIDVEKGGIDVEFIMEVGLTWHANERNEEVEMNQG